MRLYQIFLLMFSLFNQNYCYILLCIFISEEQTITFRATMRTEQPYFETKRRMGKLTFY